MRLTLSIKANICLMTSILLIMSGCTSVHMAPEKIAVKEDMRFELASGVGYDGYGRPVFGQKLDKRPSGPGSLFVILARDAQGRVRSSYLVAVTKPDGPDMAQPFNVLYTWTGKGFKRAGKLLKDIFTGEPRYESSPGEVTLYVLVAVTGVTVLITGGVVVGIADGTWEAGSEIGKLLVKGHEVLASFSTYEYDDNGRIRKIRSYLPGDPPEEIIYTTFNYKEASETPVETLTKSLIDNMEHTRVFGN